MPTSNHETSPELVTACQGPNPASVCVKCAFGVCLCIQHDKSGVAAKFLEAISFHRTLIRTQQVPPAEAIMILNMRKLLRSQLNSQIRTNLHLNDQKVVKKFASIFGWFSLRPNFSRARGSTNHIPPWSNRKLGARGKPSTFVYRAG